MDFGKSIIKLLGLQYVAKVVKKVREDQLGDIIWDGFELSII